MKISLIIILNLFFYFSFSQISIPGDFFNRIDKNDSSTLTFFPSIRYGVGEGINVLDSYSKLSINSGYSRSYNDGPIWKGKGFTWEGHIGFSGQHGKLSYTILPAIFLSQNNDFDLAPNLNSSINSFNYQFTNQIDWVQRYGNDYLINFHPGQSEIRLDLGKFVTSISTQNYSLGPSIFNPILISRQAGGFPHIRFGLNPVELSIGRVEVNLLYGLLSESDYYDDVDENDNRYFNSISFAYNPSFLKEVTLGLNKVLYKQTRYFEGVDILSPLFIVDDGVVEGDTLSPNDTFDQMASITMEWYLKESDFKIYAEYAVNDFSGILSGQFFIEPNHARGYTIGLEKRIKTSNKKDVIIQYEHTNLSRNTSFLYRPEPQFYAHGVNRQGYTHNGQIVGSGIGPGGNTDNLAIHIENSKNSYGILVQRIESNKDYFVVNIQDKKKHDQEYTLNLFYQKQINRLTLLSTVALSANFNRYYSGTATNLYMMIGSKFRISN